MLPQTLDPIKQAKLNAQFSGELLLKNLPRLQEIFDQKNNVADIELQFGQDKSKIYFISGNITAKISLICQRCAAPMQYEMNSEFLLSPVDSDERAEKLPEKYEPVFMHSEMISVVDMIEDEILLALPMVSKHVQCV